MKKPNLYSFWVIVILDIIGIAVNYSIGNYIAATVVLVCLILVCLVYLYFLKKYEEDDKA
jgi:hypothetical protein